MNLENLNKKGETNPSISSLREETFELNLIKDNVYLDINTGEKFHLISQFGEQQKMISLLVKGIINSADIIEYKGNYFSHEQDIKSLEVGDQETYILEMGIDTFILDEVFGDSDKDYKSENTSLDGQWMEHKNIFSNDQEKKKYYFDFHISLDSLKPFSDTDNEEIFKESIIKSFSEENFNSLQKDIKSRRKEALLLLKKKTDDFLNQRFYDKTFFTSVLKKSRYMSDSINNDSLFEIIKRRLEIINQVVTKEIEDLKKNI